MLFPAFAILGGACEGIFVAFLVHAGKCCYLAVDASDLFLILVARKKPKFGIVIIIHHDIFIMYNHSL